MKPSRAVVPVAAVLLFGAFLVDLLYLQEQSLSVLYALPILVAVHALSPAVTALFAVLAIVVYGASGLVQGSPGRLVGVGGLTLAIVAYLGSMLALRIREAHVARADAERARREAEVARDEAQAARAGLIAFMGMVAHDLRSPLTALLGYAQLLQRPTTSPAGRERAVAMLHDAARRMDGLVQDLLDAAGVGAGTFKLRLQPTDLVALARQAVETRQLTSPQHRLELRAPDRLEGLWDGDRLARVLDNLVDNAIKYSPEGGEILVYVRREAKEAVIIVSDQGVGLREEDLPRLFHLFSRLEKGTETVGTGLGLYITRAIVEAHGGRIWAESAGPERGSTFRVALPLGDMPVAGGG